jgi:hypothetical protein
MQNLGRTFSTPEWDFAAGIWNGATISTLFLSQEAMQNEFMQRPR